MRLLRARRVRGLEEHWHGAMPDDFLKPTDAIMRVSPPCPCASTAKTASLAERSQLVADLADQVQDHSCQGDGREQ
jgi:hypothetical protein